MKLRTGKPLWLARSGLRLRRRRLRRDVDCEVAIVGAGITGALVAHELLEAGCEVVMLDKRQAGHGSTAASTGLLLYQTDTSVADLTRLHDRRVARRVFERGREAISEIGSLVRALKTDCGWQTRQTLYVASRDAHTGGLKREAQRTERFDFRVGFLSSEEVLRRYDLDFPGGLLASGAAQVHAIDLTRGVLQRCERNRRFHLYQNTRVSSLREGSEAVTLTTSEGHRIRAHRVVDAAGYEARPVRQEQTCPLPFHLRHCESAFRAGATSAPPLA